MALSRTAKIWIIIIATPIVLLVVGLVALKLYLTSDRLKGLIIPKIEEATHRAVTVRDISFSIFPTLAVSIDSLKISNPEDTKFDYGEFIILDNIKLKVKIFELLKNKLEINYIILSYPKIYLEVSAEGESNYKSQKSVTQDKNSGSFRIAKESSGELLLSNLQIKDGEIEYVNKKSDSHLIIHGLNQTTEVTSKPGERTLQIEGTSSINKLSYGTLKMWYLNEQPLSSTIKLTYQIDNDVLKIDQTNLKLNELLLTMSGSISKLQSEEMYFNLTIASPGMQMAQLLSLMPQEMLKKTQGLETTGDIKFSMSIIGTMGEVKTPGVNGSFAVTNGKIHYASLPKSITNINLIGSFDKPEKKNDETGVGKFEIEKISGKLGDNEIVGKLSMVNFDDPTLIAMFNGSMNLGEVKEFYPLEQGAELSGVMSANISLEGKVKLPQSMKGNGELKFLNVTIMNANSPQPLKNLNGVIIFNNQLIESKQIAMNIGESDLSLAFVIKNYLSMVMKETAKSDGKPSATVTLTSKQLRTVDLISEEKPQNTHKKKNGEKQSGLLPGFDIEANVSIGKLFTEKFEFANARGSVSISGGIVTLKNFSVNAFQGTVLTKGTLDLRETKNRPFNLDIDIVGVQSNDILPKFTSFGNNLFGKFSMNTKLKGELNDTLGINTQTIGGDGKVQTFDGKLQGFPLTTKLADFTGVNELKEVSFKNWTNAFMIANGRVNISDLMINSNAADFLVNGSHGLDGSIAYSLTVKLPSSVSSQLKLPGVGDQLLQYFKDKDNRINLNFDVAGTTTSPTLKLNTKTQEEMAKQQLLELGKKKIEDELKKKAEEGLKKLFKKP